MVGLARIRACLGRIVESENEGIAMAEKIQAPDYKILPDGTTVVLVSQKATNRGTGPEVRQGSAMPFKTRHDTGDFVRRSEAEGFTFGGKEFLAGV